MPKFFKSKKSADGEVSREELEQVDSGTPTGEPCPHCGGTGLSDFALNGRNATERCVECNGSGRL